MNVWNDVVDCIADCLKNRSIPDYAILGIEAWNNLKESIYYLKEFKMKKDKIIYKPLNLKIIKEFPPGFDLWEIVVFDKRNQSHSPPWTSSKTREKLYEKGLYKTRTNKLISAHIVYNEEELLPCTIQPALKYCDKVVILDGGPSGPSTDSTGKYIDSLKEQYPGKVYVLHGTWGTNNANSNWDKEMRNAYCKFIERNLLDKGEECWLLLWDADETYTDEGMKKIKEYIELANAKNAVMIRYPYINFFYDTKHIIIGSEFDVFSHHLHIFRKYFRYYDTSTLIRDENKKILAHYPKKQIIKTEDIKLYHYSHCASTEKQKMKSWRYLKRGDFGKGKAKIVPDNIDEWEWQDTRIEEIFSESIKDFDGDHPDHMSEYVKKVMNNGRI